MKGWRKWERNNIIHVAERVFVEDAHSFRKSRNIGTCPFCKADGRGKTDDERVEELMKRVEANDAGAIFALANQYIYVRS
jgi:hypothetical protein